MDAVVRRLESPQATEVYITAVPISEGSPEEQAERLFKSIAEALNDCGARLFQERIFATEDAFERLLPVRAAAYGSLDDGVRPTLLACPAGPAGTIEGVQIHAVVCDPAPQPLTSNGSACGRTLDFNGYRFLSLSGSTADSPNGQATDAEGMFNRAMDALNDVGTDFKSVVRTWLWLGDILNWYDDFNVCRNDFFSRHGLISGNGDTRLPASTGIGVHVAGPARCAMDMLAVVGGEDAFEFLLAGGRQKAAFNYGSAFSRAAWSPTPGGRTFYVSGTASIDTAGHTTNLDDARGQIEETITNVRALLDDAKCGDDDVVQSMIYCKTPEIRELFESTYAKTLPWPQITTVAAVCRDDLLFEIEATACVAKGG